MGIGEQRCGHLALVPFHLGDTQLGGALSWRCPARRRLTLATLYVDFDLNFVNARVQDGTKGACLVKFRLKISNRETLLNLRENL